MKLRILKALLRKEVLLMKRNPFVPKMIVMMPIMVMLIVPLVCNMDVKNVGVAIVDNDRTILSRRIAADLDASDWLEVKDVFATHAEAIRMVEDGKADVVFTIPTDFTRDLGTPAMKKIDLESNGVNATKGMLGAQYAAQSLAATLTAWQTEMGAQPVANATSVINRYNITLNFINYMIPALMILLVIIICGFLPALNLVSEKVDGTMEAMNVTPVGKFIFVLSKLIPYWVIGILVILLGVLVGWLVYGVYPEGSLATILLASFLFSLVMSGIGVTIANRSNTILQTIFVMFALIMIFNLMSGMFTPIASMPDWAYNLTYAIPPRYYIEIMRAVYLKGATIPDLWLQFTVITGLAALFCGLAALTYKKRS